MGPVNAAGMPGRITLFATERSSEAATREASSGFNPAPRSAARVSCAMAAAPLASSVHAAW
ncbi:MAG: hypothetical protein RMK74_01165 [Myxococcales bacterium]|nr:hypothetical protein [Myxococcales bacterium]